MIIFHDGKLIYINILYLSGGDYSLRFVKGLFLFVLGGSLYTACELIFRGHSHWSMFLLGAVCFCFAGSINENIRQEIPLWKQVIIGTGFTMVMEFITGCIVNLWLGWNVWDYSNIPFNIMGQVCLPFSIMFSILILAAILLDDYIRYRFFGEKKPHYKFI